ncbi:MAG: hypothetical protein ACR2M0_01270 [Chloroflexia bacterium]
MNVADALRLTIRVLHVGATAIWFGGGVLHLLARSALRSSADRPGWAAFEAAFHKLARRCFWLLAASGAYLVFDRLTDTRLGVAYVLVLATKLVIVFAIGWLITTARPVLRGRLDRTRLVLGLAGGAVVLGVLLTLIYEDTLGRL